MFLVIGPLWFVVLCLAIHWLTKPKPHVTKIVTRVVRYPQIRRYRLVPQRFRTHHTHHSKLRP